MDTAHQWPEGIGVVKSTEEKKTIRPQKPQAVTCPRCNSTHTKFCYYNNYSLSQPRYFCKTCRRYWTAGGSLRNVPVGGGSRRNKRSTSTSSVTSMPSALAASMSKNHNHMMMMTQQVPNLISQNPSKHIIHNHGGQDDQGQRQGQDLTLAYPNVSHGFVDLPYNMSVDHHPENKTYHPNTTPSCSSQFSEFLKHGTPNPRGLMVNSFMALMPPIANSDTMVMNSQGLNVSLDGFENGGGFDHPNNGIISLQSGDGAIDHQETVGTPNTSASARLFFPFEDLRPLSASTSELLEPSRGGQVDSNSNGYWSGGIGGGSW